MLGPTISEKMAKHGATSFSLTTAALKETPLACCPHSSSIDITFTAQADAYKRRRKTERYRDLSMLPSGTQGPILFFGGKDYLPLFDGLSGSVDVQRVVFFNSAAAPQIRNGQAVRFQTSTRTNWHYECVAAFLTGALDREVGLITGRF